MKKVIILVLCGCLCGGIALGADCHVGTIIDCGRVCESHYPDRSHNAQERDGYTGCKRGCHAAFYG